jgi:hypothetical protein
VRPVEATEDALLAGAAAVVLPLSAARVVDVIAACHVVIKGGETEGRRLGEGAVLACPIVVQGMNVLLMLLLLLWRPYNSFSASVASSNKQLIVVYSL